MPGVEGGKGGPATLAFHPSYAAKCTMVVRILAAAFTSGLPTQAIFSNPVRVATNCMKAGQAVPYASDQNHTQAVVKFGRDDLSTSTKGPLSQVLGSINPTKEFIRRQRYGKDMGR